MARTNAEISITVLYGYLYGAWFWKRFVALDKNVHLVCMSLYILSLTITLIVHNRWGSEEIAWYLASWLFGKVLAGGSSCSICAGVGFYFVLVCTLRRRLPINFKLLELQSVLKCPSSNLFWSVGDPICFEMLEIQYVLKCWSSNLLWSVIVPICFDVLDLMTSFNWYCLLNYSCF